MRPWQSRTSTCHSDPDPEWNEGEGEESRTVTKRISIFVVRRQQYGR